MGHRAWGCASKGWRCTICTRRPAEEWALVRDTLAHWGKGAGVEEANRAYQRKRAEAVARYETLTDFRLHWDRLLPVLGARRLMLIDAQKLPGRRHLWLVPFEPRPLPAPVLPRRERGEP